MKNSTKLFFTLFLLISMLISVLSVPFSVGAVESIESSPVYSDLKKMTEIDLSLYKKDVSDNKGAKIISFLEYAYDANGNQSDYGLYLYVYNPTCEPIMTKSVFNTVQLSTLDNNGGTAATHKYKLKYLNSSTASDGADLENLFYKFEIDVENGFVSQANLNPDLRCYQITDLELEYKDEVNPRLSRIQFTYLCTGYQAYHGKKHSAQSTYNCAGESLEAIDVELHPASWKTDTSDKGVNYQYEVSSVYFNIPNYYLKKYGNMSDKDFKGLESVHMEWYEYKINGLVTNNNTLHEYAESVLGYVPVRDATYTKLADSTVPFGFYMTDPIYDKVNNSCKLGYNFADYENSYVVSWRQIGALHNSFNYSAKYFEEISSETLMESIFRKDGALLAYSYVDEGRRLGRNSYNINVKNQIFSSQLASYASTHADFVTWLAGYGKLNKGEEYYPDINCIEMITSEDFSIVDSSEAQADKLFISEGDLSGIKSFYTEQSLNNQTVYLMRFAVTDYFFADVDVYKEEVTFWKDELTTYEGDHFYFEKTIFHNFDVLDFTFRDEFDNLTTVPVSSRPISVVGTVTPNLVSNNGPSFFDKMNKHIDTIENFALWLKLIIFVVGAIILFIVIRFIIKLVAPLFNFALSMSDRVFDRKSKRRERQYREDENQRAWNRDRRDEDLNDRAWNKDRRDDDDNDRAWKEDRRKDDNNDRAWRKERREKEANDRAWNKDRRDEAASKRQDIRVGLNKRADKRAEREDVRRQEKHDAWKNKNIERK